MSQAYRTSNPLLTCNRILSHSLELVKSARIRRVALLVLTPSRLTRAILPHPPSLVKSCRCELHHTITAGIIPPRLPIVKHLWCDVYHRTLVRLLVSNLLVSNLLCYPSVTYLLMLPASNLLLCYWRVTYWWVDSR